MPEVFIYAVQGRTADQKRQLCVEVTEVVAKVFGGAKENVTVTIVESPGDAKSKGGVMFSER